MTDHGVRAYREGRCDCARCLRAFKQYQAKERERARRRRLGVPEHGAPTSAATCRCDAPIGTGECLKCGKPIAVGTTDAV